MALVAAQYMSFVVILLCSNPPGVCRCQRWWGHLRQVRQPEIRGPDPGEHTQSDISTGTMLHVS